MNLEEQRNILSNQPTGIPIDKAIRSIYNLPMGDPLRLALRFLFETGCRPSELDHMFINNLRGQIISWQPSKNQRGRPRCEVLSLGTIEEIKKVRDKFKCSSSIIPYTSESIRRIFNKSRDITGLTELKDLPKISTLDRYKYTLKGFRKTYATKKFKEYWDQYSDPHLAVIMVAKDMRHSAKEITANHYIMENMEELGINKYKNMKMWEIINIYHQPTLDFFNKKEFLNIENQKKQASLSSW